MLSFFFTQKITEVSEIEEFHKTQCDDTLTRISDLAASFESNANMLVANQDALQEKIRSLHEMLEKHFEAEESKKNEVLGRLGNLSENIEKRFNTIEKMISDNIASEKDFHPQEHPDLQFEGVEDR